MTINHGETRAMTRLTLANSSYTPQQDVDVDRIVNALYTAGFLAAREEVREAWKRACKARFDVAWMRCGALTDGEIVEMIRGQMDPEAR